MELKEKFAESFKHFNISEIEITGLWNEILLNYTSPGKYYHTLQHLAEMLEVLKPIESEIFNKEAFYLAVFYHDIIYNPQAKDNEEQSAAMAVNRLESFQIPKETIELCKFHIEATKSHAFQNNLDANILLDADLAVLGSNPQRYLEYTRQIRQEYSMYNNIIYKLGRRKVLQHFLQMPLIYKTEYFILNFEEKAKTNILNELNSL